MRFHYECCDCNSVYQTDEVMYLCPSCEKENTDPSLMRKGNLIVHLDVDDTDLLKDKEDLSIYDFFPYEVPDHGAFPIGPTPLTTPIRLREKYGIKNLTCKMDSALPSGSFKDRASQLIIGQAKHHKEDSIALASTGNAGAAMSCAGAAYGVKIVLFVPETAPVNKLMQSVLYGATVVPVKGSYDDAFALSIAYTDEFGGINRNTAYNPMTVEGKKSVSIELFLQMGKKVPDVVYVSTGDGCIYAGVVKGFLDLYQASLIDKVPQVICVQSNESNAIAQAWKTGEYNTVKATTVADSISVSSPANGRMAVRYINETKSWAVEVSDEEILSAQLELAKEGGMFVEPAASCAWAGFVKDKDLLLEKYGKDVDVCVLLTGVGFKDMAVFNGRVSLPPSIENSLEAVHKRFNSI
ncbi:MAG: pyridoxal-phosphate dependent enzyme [Spirochaetia bacterium]|nr:pyridoxal-phosphate dependent enzyme [Spirochaetia bacterium]